MTDKIKGEGEMKLIRRTRVRVECDNCGEPADQRHTYLLHNARGNPQSSGYRGDDISWCSDKELFSCAECRKGWDRSRPPAPEGHSDCSTFSLRNFDTGVVSERFSHMFLVWKDEELKNVGDLDQMWASLEDVPGDTHADRVACLLRWYRELQEMVSWQMSPGGSVSGRSSHQGSVEEVKEAGRDLGVDWS